mmetsp:Transcript_28900/g.69643  ORF Transcript_28900/g.69643 Transcript_28900/m.69643 type:complete len:199 (-) Transcript_28900:264-860(-)
MAALLEASSAASLVSPLIFSASRSSAFPRSSASDARCSLSESIHPLLLQGERCEPLQIFRIGTRLHRNSAASPDRRVGSRLSLRKAEGIKVMLQVYKEREDEASGGGIPRLCHSADTAFLIVIVNHIVLTIPICYRRCPISFHPDEYADAASASKACTPPSNLGISHIVPTLSMRRARPWRRTAARFPPSAQRPAHAM